MRIIEARSRFCYLITVKSILKVCFLVSCFLSLGILFFSGKMKDSSIFMIYPSIHILNNPFRKTTKPNPQ